MGPASLRKEELLQASIAHTTPDPNIILGASWNDEGRALDLWMHIKNDPLILSLHMPAYSLISESEYRSYVSCIVLGHAQRCATNLCGIVLMFSSILDFWARDRWPLAGITSQGLANRQPTTPLCIFGVKDSCKWYCLIVIIVVRRTNCFLKC